MSSTSLVTFSFCATSHRSFVRTMAQSSSRRPYRTGSPPPVRRQNTSKQGRPSPQTATNSPAGQCMGERIQRKLQCQVPRRTAKWRAVLYLERSPDPDRAVARPLQHGQTTRRLGLPTTGTREHRPDAPEAHVALTIRVEHSGWGNARLTRELVNFCNRNLTFDSDVLTS